MRNASIWLRPELLSNDDLAGGATQSRVAPLPKRILVAGVGFEPTSLSLTNFVSSRRPREPSIIQIYAAILIHERWHRRAKVKRLYSNYNNIRVRGFVLSGAP